MRIYNIKDYENPNVVIVVQKLVNHYPNCVTYMFLDPPYKVMVPSYPKIVKSAITLVNPHFTRIKTQFYILGVQTYNSL